MLFYRRLLVYLVFISVLLLFWFSGANFFQYFVCKVHPSSSSSVDVPVSLLRVDHEKLETSHFSDTNSYSDTEEIITFLQKINPQNDWVISTDDPLVSQALQNPQEYGFEVVDKLTEFGTVRVKLLIPNLDFRSFASLIEKDVVGVNFPIRLPNLPRSEIFDGGNSFENSFLDWLGGCADRDNFGLGVKVAIIDSGINTDHPSLSQTILRQEDLQMPIRQGSMDQDYSHGTAIASVVAGRGELITGIAPASEILSYCVTNRDGVSDSFTVASAILRAVQDGADVINISLGGEQGSEVLQRAVSYALDGGVPVVASVGNDGTGVVNFPAAYEGVIGVTSVGASGRVANFSNFGDGVDLAAPGIGVWTATNSMGIASFSGTSISAAMVTGAIAMMLGSEPSLSPSEIKKLLVKFSNDSEKPGQDNVVGHGILSLSRLENKNNRNYTDAAIAGYYFELPNGIVAGTVPVDVMVQNQGNTNLRNLSLDVNYLGMNKKFFIGSLSSGEVRSEKLYLQGSDFAKELKISAVIYQDKYLDNKPENNKRISLFKL